MVMKKLTEAERLAHLAELEAEASRLRGARPEPEPVPRGTGSPAASTEWALVPEEASGPPVFAYEYSYGEYLSGWPAAREGWPQQQAAKAAYRAPPPPEPHGPPAPQPRGYDSIVNGIWRGEPKRIVPAAPAAPVPVASTQPTRQQLDQYVNSDGSIRSRRRGRWDPTQESKRWTRNR